jgi:hypothetical protein
MPKEDVSFKPRREGIIDLNATDEKLSHWGGVFEPKVSLHQNPLEALALETDEDQKPNRNAP